MAENQTQGAPELTEEQEKEAMGRLRAFEVGIGRACDEMGVEYDDLAKAAGVDADTLGPALVEKLVEAAGVAEKQAEDAVPPAMPKKPTAFKTGLGTHTGPLSKMTGSTVVQQNYDKHRGAK